MLYMNWVIILNIAPQEEVGIDKLYNWHLGEAELCIFLLGFSFWVDLRIKLIQGRLTGKKSHTH